MKQVKKEIKEALLKQNDIPIDDVNILFKMVRKSDNYWNINSYPETFKYPNSKRFVYINWQRTDVVTVFSSFSVFKV